MFIAQYFTITQKGDNPNVHQLVNGQTINGISIQWNIIPPYKEINMAEPSKHYAK